MKEKDLVADALEALRRSKEDVMCFIREPGSRRAPVRSELWQVEAHIMRFLVWSQLLQI